MKETKKTKKLIGTYKGFCIVYVKNNHTSEEWFEIGKKKDLNNSRKVYFCDETSIDGVKKAIDGLMEGSSYMLTIAEKKRCENEAMRFFEPTRIYLMKTMNAHRDGSLRDRLLIEERLLCADCIQEYGLLKDGDYKGFSVFISENYI